MSKIAEKVEKDETIHSDAAVWSIEHGDGGSLLTVSGTDSWRWHRKYRQIRMSRHRKTAGNDESQADIDEVEHAQEIGFKQFSGLTWDRAGFSMQISFRGLLREGGYKLLQSRLTVNSCWYRMGKRHRRICRMTSQCFRTRRRAFIWWQPLQWTFSADWMRWIISVCPERMRTAGISIKGRRRLRTEVLRLQESTAHGL